jgi:hypothetical protein
MYLRREVRLGGSSRQATAVSDRFLNRSPGEATVCHHGFFSGVRAERADTLPNVGWPLALNCRAGQPSKMLFKLSSPDRWRRRTVLPGRCFGPLYSLPTCIGVKEFEIARQRILPYRLLGK